MPPVRKFFWLIAALALLVLLAGIAGSRAALWAPAAVTLAIAVALGLGGVPALRGYQYTAWIIAAIVAPMIYPAAFLTWGDFDLRNKWVVLIVVQLVMFGMGTQMSLRDFAGILKMPWGVLVAVAGQFTIMPLVGFALTRMFSFPDEIAAGIVLIGCCSSGLASNVMAYIAGANLALSITATAITTMLAPLMTPLWMKLLAGTLVEVSFTKMMLEIVKIVLVPIAAALLHDGLKNASPRARRTIGITAVIAAIWLLAIAAGGWSWIAEHVPAPSILYVELIGFIAAAVLVGVAYHLAVTRLPVIQRKMPIASMFGIVYFTAITTAAGRDHLLAIGALLLLAAMLHNSTGYFLGYWLSRACRLDINSARAIAFEVGLQNGGMATGIASAMGKLATVGLASAIFSPWMNISGSILANYWKRKPMSPTSLPPPT